MDARVGQRVEELETPVLLVDLDRMEANSSRWQRLADASGIAFRPHVAKAVDRDLQLDRLTEEHGMGVVGDDESVSVGDKLRFYSTHACTAVNLADELVGVRGDLVELVRPVLARGKRT